MMRSPLSISFLLALLFVAPACSKRTHPPGQRQASLTVVVHDQDGYAWENVEVRIVEAWTEFSACVCEGKEPWAVDFTDALGEVAFGPRELALSELGFEEGPDGVAILSSDRQADEAIVKLLVGHEELGWLRVEVPLNFRESHVEIFVEIEA